MALLTNIARVFDSKNRVNLFFLFDYISKLAASKTFTFKVNVKQLT